jgi:cyclophilin family peptidyl-prolyl cis-trans isomerase
MQKYLLILMVLGLGFLFTGCTALSNSAPKPTQTIKDTTLTDLKFPGILPDEKIKNKKAVIVTNKGTIEFDLNADKAPKTVSNFVFLAEKGFYNGLTFHRVEPNFVIQGGDPRGNGTGGPGYQFEDEKVVGEYLAGTVAMANSGPDTNGSQFFICLDDQPNLPKLYNLFGQVTSGLDVVKKIAVGDKMESVTIVNK